MALADEEIRLNQKMVILHHVSGIRDRAWIEYQEQLALVRRLRRERDKGTLDAFIPPLNIGYEDFTEAATEARHVA